MAEPALKEPGLPPSTASEAAGEEIFLSRLIDARAGDGSAAWDLFCPYRDAIWNSIYGMLQNKQDAEDAFQDTWLRALRGVRDFQASSPASLRKWLFTIAYNCSNGALSRRIRDRKGTISIDPENWDRLCDDEVGHEERTVDMLTLQELLLALPQRYREVVLLVDKDGFTRKEAAEILRRPQGTVDRQLHEARKMLRQAWRDQR